MKKKHKHFAILECGLLLDKANFFIGTSHDRLIKCDCCEDARVEIKRSLSINYEKPNEKNLDYLYKSDSEIKLKIIFYTMYTSSNNNQQKIVLLCCMDTPW